MKFLAKILPDTLLMDESCINSTVPLIRDHQIFSEPIGSVHIIENNEAIIESDVINVGDKLSAGSFVILGKHEVREVSLVKNPKFNDCEVLVRLYD